MMQKTFIFENFIFDKFARKLELNYSLDGEIKFRENFIFDFDFVVNYDEEILNKAFSYLWIMAGISYFKIFLPPRLQFRNWEISREEKDFFDKTYLQGLGEFFYTNNINPNGKINFPFSRDTKSCISVCKNSNSHKDAINPVFKSSQNNIQRDSTQKFLGSLVAIGGGKDSIVTAEILKKAGEDFETFSCNDLPAEKEMIKNIGKKHLKISRILPPNIYELNKRSDAYNGHVPISAIWATMSVCVAILRGKQNIIFSNESSANEENTEFHGIKINHQYSKSLEFEKDFQFLLRTKISDFANFGAKEINYFSFLRPLTELKIAEIFARNFFQKYKNCFTSCNKNFSKVSENKKLFWCGECAKCAFIFLIFSPFLPKTDLIDLFGKNLFLSKNLEQKFREILGISGIKPFDCVGEIAEAREAMRLIQKSGDYPECEKFGEFAETNFNKNRFDESAMPEKFRHALGRYAEIFYP